MYWVKVTGNVGVQEEVMQVRPQPTWYALLTGEPLSMYENIHETMIII